MAELAEHIMLELENRNVKSLKQTKQALESIEKNIIDNIMRNVLDTILDYVENADKPTPLEIYVWLKQRREELDTEEEETEEEQEEGET